jgi:putative nucleotidyltransferase with HDIG domain
MVGTDSIRAHLSPTQMVLFRRLQPSEQAHAFQVLERLKAAGQTDADLLTAALLHDIGKIFYPLSLCDRAVIVIGRRFLGKTAKGWGQRTPRGLYRPFVIAERHAEWGADLARQAGASSRTVDLIRRHQEPLSDPPRSPTDRLLAALRRADDSN